MTSYFGRKSLYRTLFYENGNNRLRAGNTQTASYLVYEQRSMTPNVPRYFEVPLHQEEPLLKELADGYDMGYQFSIHEKVSPVFHPFIDLDHVPADMMGHWSEGSDEDFLHGVASIIELAYRDCFPLPRQGHKTVYVMCKNPRFIYQHRTRFHHKGPKTTSLKDFGVHMVFADEKVVIEQFKVFANYIQQTPCGTHLQKYVDLFPTINGDCNLKLRTPFSDSGLKGYDRTTYCLYKRFVVMWHTNSRGEEGVRVFDATDPAPLDLVGENGTTQYQHNFEPDEEGGTITSKVLREATIRIHKPDCNTRPPHGWLTSLFQLPITEFMLRDYPDYYSSLIFKLDARCQPSVSTVRGHISLFNNTCHISSVASKMVEMLTAFKFKVNDYTMEKAPEERTDSDPIMMNLCKFRKEIQEIQVKSKRMMNTVAFFCQKDQSWRYIAKNMDLNRYEIVKAVSTDTLGISADVYMPVPVPVDLHTGDVLGLNIRKGGGVQYKPKGRPKKKPVNPDKDLDQRVGNILQQLLSQQQQKTTKKKRKQKKGKNAFIIDEAQAGDSSEEDIVFMADSEEEIAASPVPKRTRRETVDSPTSQPMSQPIPTRNKEADKEDNKPMTIEWVPFVQWWKRTSNHLVVADIVFDPSVEVNRDYDESQFYASVNSYPGYAMRLQDFQGYFKSAAFDAKKMSLLSEFRSYLRYVLLGGDLPEESLEEESLNYLNFFETYLKRLIMLPHEKTKVFLSIQGPRTGVGKSWFFETFAATLYGLHSSLYAVVSDSEHAFGTFNMPGMDRFLMMILDETKTTEMDIYGKIKQYITGDTISVNEKNEKQRMSKSRTNFIQVTNNNYSIRLEERDRRFCCFKTWTLNIKHPFVNRFFRGHENCHQYIKQCIQNEMMLLYISYLCQPSVKSECLDEYYNLQESIPKTFTYQYNLVHSMDDYNRFWKQCVERKNIFNFLKHGDSHLKGMELQKKLAATPAEESAFTHSYKESLNYFNNLSSEEKTEYHKMRMGAERNRSNDIDNHLNVLKDYQFFVKFVYNPLNANWPRKLPFNALCVEFESGNKKTKKMNSQRLSETMADCLLINRPEFQSDLEIDGTIDLPDWLSCLKLLACRYQFSSLFISTICKAKTHAPWKSLSWYDASLVFTPLRQEEDESTQPPEDEANSFPLDPEIADLCKGVSLLQRTSTNSMEAFGSLPDDSLIVADKGKEPAEDQEDEDYSWIDDEYLAALEGHIDPELVEAVMRWRAKHPGKW